MTQPNPQSIHLGDGVYVASVAEGVQLSTSNGFGVTNSITLNPTVFHALKLFAEDGLEPFKTRWIVQAPGKEEWMTSAKYTAEEINAVKWASRPVRRA